jgi:hypothetical protein
MNSERIEEILKNIGAEDTPADVHKIAQGLSRDFNKTLTKPVQTKRYVLGNSLTKIRLTELAVAAAIFISFSIGYSIGRWSKPTQLMPHPFDTVGYISSVSVHSAPSKEEGSFWRRKALAAMQPRPYIQTQTTKTTLLNAYKQYLKEKDHD